MFLPVNFSFLWCIQHVERDGHRRMAVCDEESGKEYQQPLCEEDIEQLFAQLLRRYRNPIVNLAYQMLGDRDEAEDVAQETFVQAFVHLKRFRGQSSLFTWLYRVAVNACR
ncbi:MAG: sigma-70 family RNA polymerase sigma factor, partial [Armatimonadota bacterium]